jgi:hypothetical protein
MSVELTITAILTLAIYSFLAGDNPVYRFVEHLLVGLTIGYSLVVTVRSVILPQAIAPVGAGEWQALIPLLLGAAMFLRFSRRLGAWSQIPLALVVGAGAGVALPAMLKARVLTQMAATISGVETVNGVIILAGVTATLAYFVFSREHTGVWGGITRGGRYFMMVFFGATFAYTVMSRMALLIGRLEFLLGDWLGLL